MRTQRTGNIEDLAVVGIDIGNNTFHLVGFDRARQLILRKQIRRSALTTTFKDLPRAGRPASALEAALRLNLRTVSEKTQDQLDLQALHRVRARFVSRRMATINRSAPS